MAIPGFQDVMLPLLQITSDGKEHTLRGTIETLGEYFELTTEERKEMLPSGRQARFDNRVGWSTTYLRKTKLLESTGRGRFRITDRGYDVLAQDPDRVDLKFLEQFDELDEFRNKSAQTAVESIEESNNTPEEILEESYNDLRQKLKRDLLERIKTNTPQFFESLVIDLMLAMGYGGSRRDAGEAVGRSGDGGIDGIIKEDRLGLNNIYIQAKRWENTVGRPEVQAFSGALDMHRANRGVFITTSQFSREAIEFVGRIGKKIILIDGSYLADLMIDYSVGVIIKETYIVYELNENYFDDE
ncbi:MAG: restriction endonuclease [Chloroflexota bacterium]